MRITAIQWRGNRVSGGTLTEEIGSHGPHRNKTSKKNSEIIALIKEMRIHKKKEAAPYWSIPADALWESRADEEIPRRTVDSGNYHIDSVQKFTTVFED